MKIILDIDKDIEEDCVIIRCRELNDEAIALQRKLIEEQSVSQTIELFQGGKNYFLPIKEIYFFETNGTKIAAHTKDSIYECNSTLRDIEKFMPYSFMRVSKSTILNLNYVQAVSRNITGASEVEFVGTKKTTFVSRAYFKMFMEKMKERRL